MGRTITIDPVTRIEGHSKITIQLDDSGHVADARFHVTQFRGFEKFTEGRTFHEMPSLTARICGICPVSHLVASAKTCDQLMAVRIPKTGEDLRRIMNLAQITQSHALSFFHLSAPDFVVGFDADPAERTIFGVLQRYPELARDGIRLRQFGQQVIELLGGKRIHPAWIVPGGVSSPLSAEHRAAILAMIPDALERAQRTIDWYKGVFGNFDAEIRSFANFPTLFMGLVNADGELEMYDGKLRIVDAVGKIVADGLDSADYQEYIAEYVEPDSYLKSPYYRPLGYPDGIYRVGPLARMNIIDRCGTPIADQEWAEFRMLQRGAVLSSFQYHYARLIEIIYCIEKMERLLSNDAIMDDHVRAFADANSLEGVGMSEAPRGTLLHHYKIDRNGLIRWANLIIATGNNNLAMNRGVAQVAKHFIRNGNVTEGMLNRVEAVIRTFDPCLSCSTHAAGSYALQLDVVSADGELVKTLRNF
ncbi:MAG: Ni/Fe hydrogenase subunit alpha [Anaerolineae bacterium]|nr:Ni/Fe hydrogenase subunit alpha [Anaerolineae bacterium]MCO5195085.1 Ni/Fe hydrogenase subunit alpha [Anaerolineae bacterium]MCO5197273.1 Ni/Fe hydrogenase subunit alpha [Anaerolineae bacterium]MCO5204789.1 Ni/Fe hydrogenase subunit alpha [Anaerolineae bacterium]